MKIEISSQYIKLDQLLKWAGVCGSGSEAKDLILEGFVYVNGIQVLQRGKKIHKGDKIEIKLDEVIAFTVE